MSGPGPGYGRGASQPQQYYAPQQQQQQSSYAAGGAQHDYDPASHYGATEQRPFETLYEQEEPVSPEMNRQNEQQHWGGGGARQQQQQRGGENPYSQQGYDHYDQQSSYGAYGQQQQQQGYDPAAYQQSAAGASEAGSHHPEQQQQQFDAPYYPGWIYDAASNSYLPDPDYQGDAGAESQGYEQEQEQVQHVADAQSDAGAYQSQSAAADPYNGQQYDAQGAEHGGQANDGAPPDQNQFEPPHYPGWIFDSASNSYLPDPNYQGEGEGDGATADTQQHGYEGQYPAENAQQDPYGSRAGQQHYGETAGDPYAADSNPYANEEQHNDPFAQGDGQEPYAQSNQHDPYARTEQDSFGQDDHYGRYGQQDQQYAAYDQQPPQQADYGQEAHDPYGRSDASQERAAPQQQQQQQQQQQAASQGSPYDPYAPAPASPRVQQASSASPNLNQNQNGYSPPPAQQQFTSFAAAYDSPASQAQQPYDPYAPQQQQSQQQPQSQQSQQPPRQAQAPPRQIREPGRARATSDAYATSSEAADDPYAPRQARSPATRRPTVSRPAAALSPNLTGSPAMSAIDPTPESLPTAAPPARVSPATATAAATSSGPVPPPPRASPAPAGPPPRSGQANFPAPPRSTASVAASSPQSESGMSFASPSPRPAQLPPPQKQLQQAPAPSSAGAAFDIPPLRQSTDGRGGAASRPNRAQQQNVPAAPPSTASQDLQQGPPRRNGYAPPPAAAAPRDAYAPSPQQAVQPPQQRKPAAGGLQPPARRAPHQRGASAFAGDSPYGAPPQGPPTNSYEPPQSVEEIKEEEEEEGMLEQNAEPERPEEYMPSWMQATATASPPAAPYSPPTQTSARPRPNERQAPQAGPISPQIEQEPPKRSLRGPPKLDGADALTSGMQGMNLSDRKSPVGPPPPRAAAPASGPPPPRTTAQSAAPPPPRGPASSGAAGPPRRVAEPQRQPDRSGPLSPRDEAPSFQQQQQRRSPATSQQRSQYQPEQEQQQQYAPPAQQQERHHPATPDRNAVPQLHFEAPSPNEPPSVDSRAADRAERYGYASNGRTTPVPMAGIEETPEPQEHEHDDYFGGSAAESGVNPQYAPMSEDGHMTGPTTPSSNYGGDWKADSQQRGGYDYIKQEHQYGEQQDPYAPQASDPQGQDAYAPPRDYPTREGSRTPSAPQPPRTLYASPQSRAQPTRPGVRQVPPAQREPQSAANAYSPYAPQAGQHGQPARQQHEDKKPYDPYAAPTAAPTTEAGPVADLGLERRPAPVVSFGFGGRMLLVFPRGGQPSYGIDAANPYGAPAAAAQAPSSPSTVHVRKLDDLVPQASEGAPFPGPIFLDGGKANSNKKRKEALSWLSQRIAELEQEVSYARGAPTTGFGSEHAEERRTKAESRLLLVKLLKVMLENEGKIVGSPQIDEAVRAILSPNAVAGATDAIALPTADQLAAAATSRPAGSASPFVTYGVAAADLDQMTAYLLQGDRREAVRYAVEHSMWAHAFIIASCVDTDCWKDVTNEFLQAELMPSSDHTGPGAEGREALRVAYGMFAGLGDESIQQLIPPQSLGPEGRAQESSSPMSRTGSRTGANGRMSQQALDKWQETVGMIVANRTAGDSAALTSLGDALLANGRIDAAHVCYLLSPQTSFAGGMGMPNSRIILLGSIPFASETAIDLESVKLTELLEYALSLVPVLKGHEAFIGLPHLQAFRLYHAATLADAGDVSRAHKYTEAIVNTLKLATKPSPFYHPRLVAQIKTLTERLGSAPGQKETGSWLTRKVPRPTVNSLWSTFEGGFNKFVAGEGEPTPQQLAAKAEVAQQTNGAAVGAFSHFSSIAPNSTGGLISRTQSSSDLPSSEYLQPALPVRPSSATRPTSPLAAPAISPSVPNPQHHQSPGPPPVKRASFKTHHARSSSLGAFAGYDYSPQAPPPWQSYTPPSLPNRARSNDGQDGQPTSPRGPPGARRPQFAAVEERLHEDESGFISPMAHLTPSVSPSPASGRQNVDQSQTHRRMTTAEELADLGIGNSKSKKPAFDTLEEELEAEEGGMPPPKKQPAESAGAPLGNDNKPDLQSGSKQDEKPTIKPSKSWLGGWFKREASPANTPGPVRANLGEQSGFHYDKNLGRWVNKAGKGPDEAPSPVIPPPRASTASPSRAMRSEPSRFMSEAPPPVPPMPTRSQTGPMPPLSRSATMADLRSDGRPPSAASNPTRPPSAGGLPPRMSGTPTEGLSRPSSGRGKKPKYVVVPP